MARLPQSGADAGNWGEILNEYLLESHTEEGFIKVNTVGSPQLKPLSVTSSNIANETITEDKLSSNVQAKLNGASVSSVAEATSPTRALWVLRAALSRRISTSPVVVVFTGSSSTQGTGASTEARRYVNRFMTHVRTVYPALTGTYTSTVQTLAQATASKPSGAGVFGVNAGVAGTRSDTYLTTTTRNQIAALNPRAIIHMIGANDYGNGVAVSAFKANVLSQVNTLDAAISARHVHIFIHSYPRFDDAAQANKVAAWQDYLNALYEIQTEKPDTVAVVDTSDEWSIVGVTGAPATDTMDLIGSDDIHMNDFGHEFMADLARIKILDTAITSSVSQTPPAEPETTAPIIDTSSLTSMSVNSPYSQTIEYSGSSSTFSVISGSFPTGVSMDGNGVVSGTPSSAEAYSVTILAENSAGSDSKTYEGTVAAPSAAFTTVYTSDSFVRANDTDITGSTTDTYAGGSAIAWQSSAASWNIASNAMVAASPAGGSMIPINATNYEISAVVRTMTSASNSTIFTIDGRRATLSPSGTSQYRLRYVANGTIHLSKTINGNETVLWSSTSGQIAVNDELALRLDGTTISVLKNGIQLRSVTDSSVSSSTYAGFSHAANASGSWNSMKIVLK